LLLAIPPQTNLRSYWSARKTSRVMGYFAPAVARDLDHFVPIRLQWLTSHPEQRSVAASPPTCTLARFQRQVTSGTAHSCLSEIAMFGFTIDAT
jgi:hypothetical protein